MTTPTRHLTRLPTRADGPPITPIATAIASAAKPAPELAADVVAEALGRTGATIARSVLLFLTSDFLRLARDSVLAASRAARCLQVTGCTGPGVFTEADWVLDRPAACAMVFTGEVALGAADATSGPTLSLALPQNATGDWIESGARRFGLVSSDGAGHNPGRIWGHGQVLAEGRFEAAFRGARGAIAVSRGIRILSEPLEVTVAHAYDVERVAGHPALNTLLRVLPLELREMEKLPHHLLFAGIIVGEAEGAIEQGRYILVSIIAGNSDDRSLTLAARLESGSHIFWCMRQALAAERDTRVALDAAVAELGATPDFALLFSCLGRGPYFFGGAERDLELARERLPGVPIIGTYGGGEIAALAVGNRLIHNSAVIAAFKSDV